MGLACTAQDACRLVDGALKKRNLLKGMEMPRIRTDNGPQFVANIFEEKCEELGINHERIPNKTPNLVAHIEAFHFILEDECIPGMILIAFWKYIARSRGLCSSII